MATAAGYRLPANLPSYEDTLRWLMWDQFPAIMDKSIKYFEVLPHIGTYKHFNAEIQPFDSALHANLSRDFTLSGVGSLFDYERFGHIIKRPTPQAAGTSCYGNSLCLEPTCFGFTEGVIENNNVLQDMCWSLSMPCLKDMFYSDRYFEDKIKSYFSMFFKQPQAVIQAYQRTRLLKESIKVLAVDKNIEYTGTFIGGNMSLPFYINPADPYDFPTISALPAGVSPAGINLEAFLMYMAPRFFAGAFAGGQHSYKVYGLTQDYKIAKIQTASVQDSAVADAIYAAMAGKSAGEAAGPFGGDFISDGLFPTFAEAASTQLLPVPADILEPASIYGFVQISNPAHNMQQYRGLLMVPDNWMFNLVQPPKDDFSDLGLGQGLNFRMNTPGVFPVVMSSSMFTGRTVGMDGTVILGGQVGEDGVVREVPRGLEPRERAIAEAVRTEVLMTYSTTAVNDAADGQLPNVGRPYVQQNRADGFALKSTMYVSSDVHGIAKPVLLLFKIDIPRSARAVAVCNTVEVAVTGAATGAIVGCCPGTQIYVLLTFDSDQSDNFAEDDTVIYRTGIRGATFDAVVTAITADGKTVTIQSADDETILPCCTGAADDYGVQATLQNYTGETNKTSEIFKAVWDSATSDLFIELLNPVAAMSTGNLGTITLEDGTTILVQTTANSTGVFVQLEVQVGETCVLSTLNCNCLDRATITFA